MKYNFFVLALIAAAVGVLAGCGPTPDISGSYSAAVDARNIEGVPWHGKAEVLLTQKGWLLSGNITLHHPTAGTIQIPITAGSVSGGKVVFFGHAKLPLGSIDLSFHGTERDSRIEGSVNVTLHSLFGGETDSAVLLLVKA